MNPKLGVEAAAHSLVNENNNMKRNLTNNYNLPAPFVAAVSVDDYKGGGDISITGLIAPPRITTLRKFHGHEIVEDASDLIWSLLGTSVHYMLEKSASEDLVVETRLAMKFAAELEDWTLTGQPDLYCKEAKKISDYKVTSIWSVLFGNKPEWEAQVNLQAMLHRNKGDEIHAGEIIAVMRDWQVRKAQYEKDYPPAAVKSISMPMWTQRQCTDYTVERMSLHQGARKNYEESGFESSSLPLCTPEERWLRGGKVAVYRKNAKGAVNKRADRIFSTEKEAHDYIGINKMLIPKGTSFLEPVVKPGENVRCESYCNVRDYCDFYKSLVNEKAAQQSTQPELIEEE